jgi:hypothetical protein
VENTDVPARPADGCGQLEHSAPVERAALRCHAVKRVSAGEQADKGLGSVNQLLADGVYCRSVKLNFGNADWAAFILAADLSGESRCFGLV